MGAVAQVMPGARVVRVDCVVNPVSQRAFDALAGDWSAAGKGAHAFPVFFGAAPEQIAAICEGGFDAAPRTAAAEGCKATAPDAGVAAAGAVNPSSPRAQQSS